MWSEFIHHLTLHFTIVLPMVLAAVGLYSVRTDGSSLQGLIRWTGIAAVGFTVITVASGLIAGGFSGGEESMQHHRYLGITTSLVIALAAWSYDRGVRTSSGDWRSFGVAIWWVATLSVIGAGHWGGLSIHAEVIPF